MLVASDIGQYFLQLREMRRRSVEHQFRGLGVAQNGAQRLRQLMRNRRRQFPDGRATVHVSELGNTLVSFDLGTLPPAAFVKQAHDQCGLEQNQDENRGDLPAVTLPDGRFAEADFATWWQIGLSDAPALEFAPIELRGGEANG